MNARLDTAPALTSAALYIHIPFCLQKCSYCDFYSCNHSSAFKPYKNNTHVIKKLLSDAAFFKHRYDIHAWETVYIGGGTPSLLCAEDVYLLASSLCKNQTVPIKEFTIEANPEDISSTWLTACAAGGITRLSIGVQSLCNSVLTAAGRRGSRDTTLRALNIIKQQWHGIVSYDLIAGLSGQTDRSLCEDIQYLVTYEPEHISLYGLCSETPLTDEQEDTIYAFLQEGFSLLEKNNYIQYEISNFSRYNNYKSIHNTAYWHMENYIGIGPAACGTVIHTDGQGHTDYAERFVGISDADSWINQNDRLSAYSLEQINKKHLIEEVCIMGFRLVEGVNRKRFIERFGNDITHYIGNTLQKWEKKGYCIINDTAVGMTQEGLFSLNQFLVDILIELDSLSV